MPGVLSKPLNRRLKGVDYHPAAEKHGFVCQPAQRTREWYKLRFENPVTASRIPTILYKQYYGDDDDPPPLGVDIKVWNKQRLFEQLTCQKARVPMQNTGNLFGDHIRRGVYGEDVVTRLAEAHCGHQILEMPSVQHPYAGFIWASADGLDSVTGQNVEIKMPYWTKEFCCAKPYTERIWLCNSVLCRGYHKVGLCEYQDILKVCSIDTPCIGCKEYCTTIYWDQIQCQREVLGTPSSVFVQLRSKECINEVLNIPKGLDRKHGIDWEERVDDFCCRPFEDMELPAGKKPIDYLKWIEIPPQEHWFKQNICELWDFHAQVMQYRKDHHVTFEDFARLNNLTFAA